MSIDLCWSCFYVLHISLVLFLFLFSFSFFLLLLFPLTLCLSACACTSALDYYSTYIFIGYFILTIYFIEIDTHELINVTFAVAAASCTEIKLELKFKTEKYFVRLNGRQGVEVHKKQMDICVRCCIYLQFNWNRTKKSRMLSSRGRVCDKGKWNEKKRNEIVEIRKMFAKLDWRETEEALR